MKLTWLADVLRAAGLDVWESPGWEGRGRDLDRIEGIVWHHTASSPRTSDTVVHAILRDGRPDLAGPLAQLGLERDGTFVVVADGKANHNGYGEWGNASIGVEAYNDGIGEPWPLVQVDAYRRGTAAILTHLGLSEARVKGHKETDPERKIDPTLDMREQRALVRSLLITPTLEDPLMALTDAEARGLVTDAKTAAMAATAAAEQTKRLVDELIEYDPSGKGTNTRADRMAKVPGAVAALDARLARIEALLGAKA